MSTRKQICSRRPMWGVAAMGVFACSLTLYGAPGDGPSRTGRDKVDLGDHVLVAGPMANVRTLQTEIDGANFVTIRGGFDGAGGSVANTGDPAVVYQSGGCGFISTFLDERFGRVDQMKLGNIGSADTVQLRSFSTRACTDMCGTISAAGCAASPPTCAGNAFDPPGGVSGCYDTGEVALWRVQLWDANPCNHCDAGPLEDGPFSGTPGERDGVPCRGDFDCHVCNDDGSADPGAPCTTDPDCPGGTCNLVGSCVAGSPIPGTLFEFDLGTLGPGQDGLRNCANAVIQLDPKLEVGREVWIESYLQHDDGWLLLGNLPGQPGQIGSSPLGSVINGKTQKCNSFFEDGPDANDCSFLKAEALSNAQVTIKLQPKSVHVKGDKDETICDSDPETTPPDCDIVGSEIKISKGGVNIQMEFQISDWSGPDLENPLALKAYQIRLDSSGFTSALKGTLEPKLVKCEALCDGGSRDGQPCQGDGLNSGNADCADKACEDSGDPCSTAASCDVGAGEDCLGGLCLATDAGQATCFNNYGGTCSVFGNVCFSAAACEVFEVCTQVNKCLEKTQVLAGFCAPVYIVSTRSDHAMQATAAPICAVDVSVLDYATGCALGAGFDPQPYADINAPEKGAYGGTVWVHLSDNSAGTFTIDIFEFPDSTLVDQTGQFIPLVGLIPAKITVQIGKCCAGIGANDNKHVCIDQLTENQCDTVGVCKGNCDLNPAIQCASDKECQKLDPSDVCVGGGTLGNTCLNDAADAAKKGLDCDSVEKCVAQGISIWSPKESCSGVFENDCPSCLEDNDCLDGNGCTVDRCQPDGTCTNTKVAAGHSSVCDGGPNDGLPCIDDLDCPGDSKKDSYCRVAECCDPNTTDKLTDVNGGGAVTQTDDGNQCTRDSCDKGAGRGAPVHVNQADGWQCNDGDCGTDQDVCSAGACAGGVIEGRDCNSDAECENKDNPVSCLNPSMSCDLVGKVCRKGLPQLEFDIHLSGKDHFCTIGGNACTSQDDCTLLDPETGAPENCAVVGGGDCFAQGEKVIVDVNFSSSLEPGVTIVGGQFIVDYDPDCLAFVSIVPGGDPFVFELQKRVDQAAGRIFYAVGVNPFGGVGNLGGTLATMSFTKLAGQNDCPNCFLTFDSVNPFNTYLADSNGKPVVLPTKPSKEIHVNDRLSLNVPPGDGVNSECDERGAVVTWDAPTAASSCADPHGCDPAKKKCYDVNLVCQGSGPFGPYPQSVVMNGGLLDQGRSQFCCTATGKICGDSVNDCWTVDVNDQVSLDITVQLQPIMAATTLTRCIEFQLYEDCTQNPMCFRQDLVFGGNNFIGKSSGKKKIPKAQWACMTARDQSHSLESCTFLDCRADGNWEAVFAGDPFFGGNWLIQGNLDEWQKLQPPLFGSPDVIDILDFATFLIQFGQFINPNTPCDPSANDCTDPLVGPHADINGDGVVDATDFAFIFDNFLVARKNCCCDDATAGLPGRTEVSVRELRESGLDDLIVADLNRDGLVNMADMNEFLSGKRPEVKGTSRTRTGSGIGSRR